MSSSAFSTTVEKESSNYHSENTQYTYCPRRATYRNYCAENVDSASTDNHIGDEVNGNVGLGEDEGRIRHHLPKYHEH